VEAEAKTNNNTSLDLGLRAYDFRRENDNDTIAEANALGTDLTYCHSLLRVDLQANNQ